MNIRFLLETQYILGFHSFLQEHVSNPAHSVSACFTLVFNCYLTGFKNKLHI